MIKAWMAVLAGAVIGAVVGKEFDALFGAVVGWLWWGQRQQMAQMAQMAQLQRQLQEQAQGPRPALHAAGQAASTPAVAATADGPIDDAALEAQALAATSAPLTPATAAALASHQGSVVVAAAAFTASAAPEPAPALPASSIESRPAAPTVAPAAPLHSPAPITRAEPDALERAMAAMRGWLFGGNTIVKAGVGILFIGLAFLAKYASEHTQVPVEYRLAGVGAAAVVLLVLGWRLRLRRAGYAQVLQGGAVAVLYLTLFVAWRWFGVLGMLPVFAAMVLVAALAATLALLQNAMALAVIGALGGFAVPLLVSSGSGNHVALFSYYAVLDVGILAVAWFRTWRPLNMVGFVFTFGVGSLWGVSSYQNEHYASAQSFLIFFFLLFAAVLMLPARRAAGEQAAGTDPHARWVNGSLLFGLPTLVFGLQMGLLAHLAWDKAQALAALILAAAYVGMAVWARRQPAAKLLFEGTLAVAAVLITLTMPLALGGRATATAWALEGAGLVWLGLRQQRRLARALGYLLIVVGGVGLLHGHQQAGVAEGWLNGTLIGAVLGTLATLVAAYAVRRDVSISVSERMAEPLLIGWSGAVLAVVLMVHVDQLVPLPQGLAASLTIFGGVPALYAAAAARWDWPHRARVSLGQAPVMALLLLGSVGRDTPWQDGLVWAWPLAFAAHAAVLRFAAPLWSARSARLIHALGLLVLVGLGALIGRAVTRGWGDEDSAWRWLGLLAVPALGLLALLKPALLRCWPLRLQPGAYHPLASAVLVVGLLLWVLLANLASNGAAQPLPHVPLINPLDLGLALALFAAWRWQLHAHTQALWTAPPALAPGVLGALGFLWLNGMLVRAFHHWADVPYALHAWAGSLAVQTGLTLLWSSTALALMWWAARRSLRAAWVVGAVLLAVVVGKLAIVDLSGSGTVMRIVSFIGVGVLMLVIGYVAPLPARAGAAPAVPGADPATRDLARAEAP